MTKSKSHKDMAIEIANKRKYAKKYYETHKAEARARYLKDKEKIKARSVKWKVDNRAQYLEQQARYDLFKRGSLTIQERFEKAIRRREKRLSIRKGHTPSWKP